MKNTITLVLILFSTNVFAASGSGQTSNIVGIGGAPQITTAATATTQASNIVVPISSITGSATVSSQGPFTITCGNGSVALVAADFYPCYKDGSATNYQVSAGSTFHTLQTCYSSGSGAALLQMVNATAAITNPATSITGGKYESGQAAIYSRTTSGTATAWSCDNFVMSAAASTYVGIQVQAATNYFVKFTGFETTP